MAWDRYKNLLTMEELAGFFNVSLKSIYRIIKNYEQRTNNIK